MNQSILEYYYANLVNNYEPENWTLTNHLGNSICGDDVTIFLKLEDDSINSFFHTGNSSLITKASCSFLAEFIEGKKIVEVLTWNYKTLQNEGLEVSTKRQRAAVLGLLATKNALHEYLKDSIVEDFDDVLIAD